MRVLLRTIVTVFIALLLPLSALAEIKVALNSPRGELATLQKWQKLGPYLEQQLGDKVTVVPLLVTAIIEAAAKGEFDFIFANPMQTLVMREQHGYVPVATLSQKDGPYFAGVIIANPKSGIKTVADLRGKKVMALSPDAAAAHIFQAYHLQQQGIDIHHDFAAFQEAKKLDDIVLAVKSGLFDAGFIRTGVLESMTKEGKIQADDVVVVDERKDPDFNQVHTTILYPEWFFCAKPGLDAAVQERMTKALLQVEESSELGQSAKIKGFVAAQPLDDLLKAVKSLKIAPFDQP